MRLKKITGWLLLLSLLFAAVPLALAGTMRSNQLGQNLITYSERFENAAWVKGAGVTVTANQAQAPDGTMTADTVAYDGASGAAGGARIYQNAVFPVVAGTKATGSIWLRTSSGTVTLSLASNQNTVGTTITVTSSWQRFSDKYIYTSAFANSILVIYSAAADNSAFTVYAWGAQEEYSGALGAYNPTVASAKNTTFVPTGSVQSNQLGQNVYLRSEQFDSASWAKASVTVSANASSTFDPLGGHTADMMVDSVDGGVTNHYINQSAGGVLGHTYTMSVYAKAGTRSFIDLSPNGASVQQNFNLATGSVGSLLNDSVGGFRAAGIQSVGNGWYRVWVTWKDLNSVSDTRIWIETNDTGISYTGDGTGTIYLWGAQVVEGSKPAAYNPTGSATVNPNYAPSGVTILRLP